METINHVSNYLVKLLLSLLLVYSPFVQLQTVTITTSTLTPNLGTTDYFLQCDISNFVAQTGRALAWTKDGDLVGWDRVVHGGFNGRIQETGFNPIMYSLFFFQVDETHRGVYKCLIADGQPQPSGYTEITSDQITVQIPYFPPVGNPVCSPSEPTIAVAGTQLSMTCSSLPGLPDEVNLFLRRSGQFLSSGQKVNDLLQLEYMHPVSVNDIGASFTCVIVGTGQYNEQSRTCYIGQLEIVSSAPRIMPSSVTKSVGQDATFTCELSSPGNTQWYTEPASFSSQYSVNGNTFTLTNVQLSDNGKTVVCKVTIGEASVEKRGHLMVVAAAQPKVTTSKPNTPARNTPIPNQPMPVVTERSEDPTRTSNQIMASTRGLSGQQSPDTPITTAKSESNATPLPSTSIDSVIIIAIAAVGGLVFILIIVIIIACICCYRRQPKPVVMADDKDSFDDSEISWEARADGAMTRQSRIQYRTDDSPDEPPPRRPAEDKKGFEDERSRHHHLLKIPDGLSTVTSGSISVSPSLAYAMEYLNSPDDPLSDDMSSIAQTVDSRNYLDRSNQGPLERGFTGDTDLYSQGPTDFGGPPSFDPAPPGTRPYGKYQGSEVSDSGTFVKNGYYDSVPAEFREQEPDMPTYALPHRDRISKNTGNQKVVYNPNSQKVPNTHHDVSHPNVKRNSSIPYVNTAFEYNDGTVPGSIYQTPDSPTDNHNPQYF